MSVSPDIIRDILESAVEEHEPAADSAPLEVSAPHETEGEAAARVERARDEAGRFTRAEREAQASAAPEPAKTRPPRPSTTTPKLSALTVGEMHTCWHLPATFSKKQIGRSNV